MVKKLDHVGIVVDNLEESIPLYESILGEKPVSVKDVPTQGVRAAFFEAGNGVVVELIEPLGPDSSVARFLEKQGDVLLNPFRHMQFDSHPALCHGFSGLAFAAMRFVGEMNVSCFNAIWYGIPEENTKKVTLSLKNRFSLK